MSEESPSAWQSFRQRPVRYTVPIVAVAVGLFAFHWQALRAEEQRVRERSEARAEALAEVSALALREPMLRRNVPAVMILVEGLVRESGDVLSARVGGKDGAPIAETEDEGLDETDSQSVRVLTRPIVVQDGSGPTQAIGTIDIRVSTKAVAELAAANGTRLWIEGGLCLLLCGGLVLVSRKRGRAPASSPARTMGAGRSMAVSPRAAKSEPAKPRGKREKSPPEPRAPRPGSDGSGDDEPVEVTLDTPGSTTGSR